MLPTQVLEALAPRPGGRYLDGTLGLGGHAAAVLAAAPAVELCGLDRDAEALELAGSGWRPSATGRIFFTASIVNLHRLWIQLGWDRIDGALLDIGVSSLQLDEPERGFSFHGDGPLDMRMDPQPGLPSAWHWVNRESFARLKECIATLGEEPQAGRIARVIVEARQKASIDTTAELAALVEKAYPAAWRARARRHPATRTFQALRMAVNDELGELRRFLDGILSRLSLGGRLAVITFHSLEDRMVKQAHAPLGRGLPVPPACARLCLSTCARSASVA